MTISLMSITSLSSHFFLQIIQYSLTSWQLFSWSRNSFLLWNLKDCQHDHTIQWLNHVLSQLISSHSLLGYDAMSIQKMMTWPFITIKTSSFIAQFSSCLHLLLNPILKSSSHVHVSHMVSSLDIIQKEFRIHSLFLSFMTHVPPILFHLITSIIKTEE